MNGDDVGHQTLAQLDDVAWPAPAPDATRLIKTVYALRNKPIQMLGVEDLRVLLGQQIAVDVLVPRALNLLLHDPLAAGDYYPGDLFTVVVRIPAGYWTENPESVAALRAAIRKLEDRDDLEVYLPPDDEIWTRIGELRDQGIV